MKRKPSPQISLNTFITLCIGAMFVVVGAVVIGLVNRSMRQQAMVEAQEKTRIILDRNLATHTYFSHNLKPALFALTDPVVPKGYFDPTWMSSTYAVREIDQYFQSISSSDYYYKEAAINARTPQNEADNYERAFIEELNQDPSLEIRSEIRILDGKPYFVTLRRGEVMEASCLRCHSTPEQAPEGLIARYGSQRSFARQEGEIVSAISIRVPIAEAYAQADRVSLQLSIVLILLLVFLFTAQTLLYRHWLITPLNAIREKAIQIATENERLGEQIPAPSGRELRELTDAFNTMSLSLRRSRDQLEERVRERTADLKQSNERLSSALADRDVLLREVHHRVKNNLSIVINLLNLQSDMVENENARAALEESQDRVYSLAHIHEHLYRSPNLENVDMPAHISELVESLQMAYGADEIAVKVNVGDVRLPLAVVSPCSLLINELVSNAFKHAFPGGRSGAIQVTLQPTDGENIELVVSDNGVGLPPDLDLENSESLGLKIAHLLAQQIGGALKIEGGEGTTFKLMIPAKSLKSSN